MDISIAMCTYDGWRGFLAEQLCSIREQTKLPHELIICDDACTDATPRIVHAFALGAPFPVRLFRNQATWGSTRNFEKAIRALYGSGDRPLRSGRQYGYPTSWNGWQVCWTVSPKSVAFVRMPS